MKKTMIITAAAASLLSACAEPSQDDMAMMSVDFLCENYIWNIQNPQSIVSSPKPYRDELKRRGADCKAYQAKADITMKVE